MTATATAPDLAHLLAERNDTTFMVGLSEHLRTRFLEAGFRALPTALRVLWLVDHLERAVNEGGFRRYFASHAGDRAEATHAALVTIGALRMALLLEEAMRCFPQGRPAEDRETRVRQLDAFGERATMRLRMLDDAFHAYPDDLAQLVRRYTERHLHETARAA